MGRDLQECYSGLKALAWPVCFSFVFYFSSPSTCPDWCWEVCLWLFPSLLLALFPHSWLNVDPPQLVLLQSNLQLWGLPGTPEPPQPFQPGLTTIHARYQPLTLVHPQQSRLSQNRRTHATPIDEHLEHLTPATRENCTTVPAGNPSM